MDLNLNYRTVWIFHERAVERTESGVRVRGHENLEILADANALLKHRHQVLFRNLEEHSLNVGATNCPCRQQIAGSFYDYTSRFRL